MEKEVGFAVKHWDVATGKKGASFWAPQLQGLRAGGHNAGVYFTALSADGKTVAWGGAEEREAQITGTAHVWEVQSLTTTPPGLTGEPAKLPADRPGRAGQPPLRSVR